MKLAIVVLMLALAGCAPGYERIGFEKPDATYQKSVATTTSTGTGGGTYQIPIFVKRFEDNGRLALCGYMLPGGTSMLRDLFDDHMSNRDSRFTIDSQVIGDLSFIMATGTSFDGLGAQASCVRTRTPWTERLKNAPYRMTWPGARVKA